MIYEAHSGNIHAARGQNGEKKNPVRTSEHDQHTDTSFICSLHPLVSTQ